MAAATVTAGPWSPPMASMAMRTVTAQAAGARGGAEGTVARAGVARYSSFLVAMTFLPR